MSGFMATPVETIVRYDVGSTPQSVFVVPFPFDDIDDLLVTVDDVPQLISLSGTVEVEGFFTAANVVLPAPVSNVIVYVQRRTFLTQQVKYPQAGSFRTQPLNAEISRLWMALQDLRRELDFALGVALGTDTIFTPNALVNTIVNTIIDKLFPPGMICGWAGFIDDVPEGWELVLAMQDKFIVAAGPTRLNNTTGGQDVRESAAGGGQPAGVTGGRALTVAQLPPHNHDELVPTIGTTLGSGATGAFYGNPTTAATSNTGNGDPHDHPLPEVLPHVHQITVVPAYYALAFIMRTGVMVSVPPDLGDIITLPEASIVRYLPFKASNETTPLVVATALIEVTSWVSMAARKVKLSLRTASSSGAVEINVRVNGVVMTAAPISIPVGIKVVTVTVLALTAIAENDAVTVDVVAAGTGATGLQCVIEGTVT